MTRMMLTESLWNKLKIALHAAGAYDTDHIRMNVEGILWRFRTGAPWRDLPADFGAWKTVYNRFNNWSKSGIWNSVFIYIRGELDDEWNFMDGSYIKAHQHASGGLEASEIKTIGTSRGGNTTKIHMLTDAHGNPVKFEITAGNIHDVSKGKDLIDYSNAEHIIADKGYDSDELRDYAPKKALSLIFQENRIAVNLTRSLTSFYTDIDI